MENTEQKAKKPKKLIVILVAAVMALALIAFAVVYFAVSADSPKTPVRLTEKLSLPQNGQYAFLFFEAYNGAFEEELTVMKQAVARSSALNTLLEEAGNTRFGTTAVNAVNAFGDDLSVTFAVGKTVKLDEKYLTNSELMFQSAYASYLENVTDDEAFAKDHAQAFAEKTGLSEEDANAFIRALIAFSRKIDSVKLTEGARVQVTRTYKGSKTDDARIMPGEMVVLKLDGRWVSRSLVTDQMRFDMVWDWIVKQE